MPLSLVLLLAPLHDAMHTAVMIIANVNVLILIVGVLKLFPYTLITQYFPFCDTPATIFFTNIVKGERNTKTKKACVFWFLGLPSRILPKVETQNLASHEQPIAIPCILRYPCT